MRNKSTKSNQKSYVIMSTTWEAANIFEDTIICKWFNILFQNFPRIFLMQDVVLHNKNFHLILSCFYEICCMRNHLVKIVLTLGMAI